MAKVVKYGVEWVLEAEEAWFGYKLPAVATMEKLWDWKDSELSSAVVRYGDHVIFADDSLNGVVLAVYEILEDGRDAESLLGLIWMDTVFYEDAGHALDAGFKWVKENC